MKKIIVLSILALIPCLWGAPKTYNVGVMYAMGYAVKIDMKIHINDSLVIFSIPEYPPTQFKIVKESNGTIYFTDGIMMDFISILNVNGKIKGFKYNKNIIFTHDFRRDTRKIVYYARQDSIN